MIDLEEDSVTISEKAYELRSWKGAQRGLKTYSLLMKEEEDDLVCRIIRERNGDRNQGTGNPRLRDIGSCPNMEGLTLVQAASWTDGGVLTAYREL